MIVEDLMTRDVFTLQANHKIDLAKDIMDWERIRHIPIIDDQNTLVGILTSRDLLKGAISSIALLNNHQQRELDRQTEVSELMNRKVLSTQKGEDVRDAAKTMREKKIGCLPVVDENNKIVGILTESDFLTLAWENDLIC